MDLFTSNGDHLCTNCGAIPAGVQMVTVDDNDYCLDCVAKTADEARQLAIDWQNWQSEQSLYMSEVADWQAFFEALAKKFNLTDEFKENAII